MRRRWAGWIFGTGFAVLLIDGAAAIWLGQISGRWILVAIGVALVLAAGGFALAYRRWMEALDAVEVARRELQIEIRRLRDAVSSRPGPSRN